MGVEREEIKNPIILGSMIVSRIYRHPAGRWTVEFEMDFKALVGDGRTIHVKKIAKVTATEQRGRKPQKSRASINGS